MKRPKRDRGELRQLLVLQLETEFFRVKRNGPAHVLDLISNAVKSDHKTVAPGFFQLC